MECVFFSHTTYGSTSVIACVLFLLATTGVIACVFSLETTHGSTSVIACVFFSESTHGSTSIIEMCVLLRDHTWIHQCHCMCIVFTNNNQSHRNVCSFHI